MHPQDVATGAIEPRENDDLIARAMSEGLEHSGLEYQPGSGERPSWPCLGADSGSVIVDSTNPIGITVVGRLM